MICLACNRFMRTKKGGITVEEMYPDNQEPAVWYPYQLWKADLYECPACHVQMVGGFGSRPIAEHFQPTYAAMRELHGPILMQVFDCGPRHLGPMPHPALPHGADGSGESPEGRKDE